MNLDDNTGIFLLGIKDDIKNVSNTLYKIDKRVSVLESKSENLATEKMINDLCSAIREQLSAAPKEDKKLFKTLKLIGYLLAVIAAAITGHSLPAIN